MGEAVLLALAITFFVGTIFWLSELVSVITFNDRYFESHTHRLMWFLVVFLTFIIGAIWFQLWKDRAVRLWAEEFMKADPDTASD